MITALAIEALAIERGGRVLFSDLSFRACAGEAVAIVGANGAGKTSLLRAVAGLIRPSAGRLWFEGTNGAVDAGEARRDHCHLIGHEDAIAGGRTARDELIFAVGWTGGDPAGAIAAAERFGLGRVLGLEARKLSAGQRRRLALVRLIAASRTLWLLDEAFTPLDGESRGLLGEAMKAHLLAGGIVLAAAHDPLPLAARIVAIAG